MRSILRYNHLFSSVLILLLSSALEAKDENECSFTQDSFRYYLYNDTEKAIKYVTEHLDLPEDSPRCRYKSFLNCLSVEVVAGNKHSVDSLYHIIKESKYKDDYPRIVNKAGQIAVGYYINNSFFEEAEELLNNLLEDKSNTSRDSIKLFVNLSILYNNTKDFENSVRCLQQATTTYEASGLDEYILFLDVEGQAGVTAINMEDHKSGIESFKKCIKVAKANSAKKLLSYFYICKAFSHDALQQFELSEQDLDSATYYITYDSDKMGFLLNQKVTNFSYQSKFDKAEEVCVETIKLLEKTNRQLDLLNALKSMLSIRGKQKKVSGYKPYLDQMNTCCQDLFDAHDTIVIGSYNLIESIGLKDENHALALLDHFGYIEEYNRDNIRLQLNDAHVKYESEKKETENKKLITEQQLKANQINTQQQMLIGGTIALAFISLLTFLFYRQREKQKQLNTELTTQRDQIKLLNRELNHRVKNNLAFMTSLLEMQGRRTDSVETKQILRESESRLKALSIVHNNLFQSETHTTINLKSYLLEIVSHLQSIFEIPGKSLTVETQLADIDFDAEDAMRVGLVVNELVTNSVKHAFADVDAPKIILETAKSADGKIVLRYKDNGPGYVQKDLQTASANSESIGVKLIQLLEKQLAAKLDLQLA